MSSPFDESLDIAFQHLRAYLGELSTVHVGATRTGEELAERFEWNLPDGPVAPSAVVEELIRNTEGGLTAVGSGRFFGWVVGGSLPAAMAADILAVGWDQVPGVYSTSPAAAIVEEVCGRWLLEALDLPRDSGFALVTGCQMAHVTCLAAARNSLLHSRGWDVETKGLFGAPAFRILTGELCHGTVKRALRLLGIGTDAVHVLPCTEGAVDLTALAAALTDAEQPTIVVLQAGEVNTGAFDPFAEAVDIAKQNGAWVHVDGAFGLWARASSRHRELAAGIERADSWATDGHKWLNVPYDCGYAFVADANAHRRAFSHQTAYLMQSETQRDAVDWTPEHSRRARCFATYAALRSLGRIGISELVDTCCLRARDLVEGAARIPGVEVVHMPTLNQGLLRFPSPQPDASEHDSDVHTAHVVAELERSGVALFTTTHWDGKLCMRVSVSNWQTSINDIDKVLATLREILASVGH